MYIYIYTYMYICIYIYIYICINTYIICAQIIISEIQLFKDFSQINSIYATQHGWSIC